MDGAAGVCLSRGVLTSPKSFFQPEPHNFVAFVAAEEGWGLAAGPWSGFGGLSSMERQKFRFSRDIFTWALRAP